MSTETVYPVDPQDLNDALEHLRDSYEDAADDYTPSPVQRIPLDEALRYDDYSSWGEIDKGELVDLDSAERRDVLSFRSEKFVERALQWIEAGDVPPIIIFPEEGIIGDGRGRMNVAVGMNWETVPVVFMRPSGDTKKLKTKLLK